VVFKLAFLTRAVVDNGPICDSLLASYFPPNSSTRPLTEIECFSMADVPGEFMITSGSRRFGGPSRTFCLNSLFTGSIYEIDSSITPLQHDLSILPRSDPRRLICMISLAVMRLRRLALSNQREDLDKATVHLTESILLSPLLWLQHGPIILSTLFALARALLLRSNLSKQPEDAICATKYLSLLRDQPYEIPSISRYQVTALLVHALSLQVDLAAGNVMQNIREMVVLSRELLETSDDDATHFIKIIDKTVTPKLRSAVPDQPLDELIEFSRVATKRRPDLLEGRMTFAKSLVCRYYINGVNDDYEEAASILDDIITYRSSGNSEDESLAKARTDATGLVTALAGMRSIVCQTPEYLEEAIYRTRTCAGSPSVQDLYPSVILDPEFPAEHRFRYFGSIEGVEESSSNALADVFPEYPQAQAPDEMEDLLFVIRNTDDTTEIDEVIEKGRSILVSSPQAPTLSLFANTLFEAFDRTKKIKYLNESISTYRQLIEYPHPQALRFLALPPLSAFSDRFIVP
jgi:hypothetical protein